MIRLPVQEPWEGSRSPATKPIGPNRPSCAQALVLLLLSASSACVIPVVPEFEDPPESVNLAPRIERAIPDNGDTLFKSQPLTVRVIDPNGDALSVRWIADYPSPGSWHLFQDIDYTGTRDGTPSTVDATTKVSCDLGLSPDITLHKIMMIVSDRDFREASETGNLTTPGPGGFTASANWLFQANCPPNL